MKRLLVILIGLMLFCNVQAQTRKRTFRQHEVGIYLGGSYYIGDLNSNRQFFLTQPAFGAFYRFTPNYRYAFRAGYNYGGVAGDDSQSEDSDQRQRNLNFKTDINEFYIISEFNFLEYRISNDKYKFSAFLFAGISVFTFKPLGNLGAGQWESLQPLQTEGQSIPYGLVQVAIPFGIGFKVNVSKRIGLGLEWGPRKTFTDYLDDVSGTYPDPKINPPNGLKGLQYSNRTRGGADVINSQRGNPSTQDWYIFCGLTINIKLNPRPVPCHAYGSIRTE